MEWNGSSWSGGTIWSVRPPISEQQPRQPQQPQPQPQPQQPQQQEVVQGGEPPGDHTCLIAARFGGSEDAVPEAFVCSITQRVMLDPVVAADGHTYDRAAILRWFAQGRSQLKSPLSGDLLRTTELLPNNNLRSQIQNFSTTTDNGTHGSAAEFNALERENMRLSLELGAAETAADELREKLQARTRKRDGARAERDAARAERDAAERKAEEQSAIISGLLGKLKQSKRPVRCHALKMEAQKQMLLEKILKLTIQLKKAEKLNKAAATAARSTAQLFNC